MPSRRAPTDLHATLAAQPAGIHVFVIRGMERLVFTTADLAELVFGKAADADEAKRHQAQIRDYHHRGHIHGRQIGNYLLFNGAAVADFVRSLDQGDTA